MSASSSLARLICGTLPNASVGCEVADVLRYLSEVIENEVEDLDWLFSQSDSRVSRLAPLSARVLTEVGATALMARLDPTRVLFIKRVQELEGYLSDRPWKTAMRWQGDVVADKVGTLWDENKVPKELTRALVGDYFSDLYWSPAYKRLADYTAPAHSQWVSGLMAVSYDRFIAERRKLLSEKYSQTSKSIHHEYVSDKPSRFDRPTSKAVISDVLKVLAEFGFLTSFLPHLPYRTELVAALELVRVIESYEVGND